ncbi:hypothetical protein OUZ56_010703 [Daphnia magna]|uniref:C2H2-type domain-containing protein n=1 Tax=Daphnia magna TaxID=35525 RepID=A0ABQ9YYI0_9CRUS|nr:hypothetical protein OUZ56_010703 [Daphnia magna]
MLSHYRTVHRGDRTFDVPCLAGCDRRYRTEDGLRKHLQSHHPRFFEQNIEAEGVAPSDSEELDVMLQEEIQRINSPLDPASISSTEEQVLQKPHNYDSALYLLCLSDERKFYQVDLQTVMDATTAFVNKEIISVLSKTISSLRDENYNFFVLPQELIAENASSHSLRDASEGNCVLDNSETSTDIVDSSCDDHAQNIRSVAKNLKKRKLCLQSWNPPSKTTCLTTAVLKERREPTSVPLPANFNLPNRFRLDIQQKLDDSSSVFMAKDQSAFLREVANAIQLYSYKPSEFELANIVSEILLKYPHASSLPTAEAKHKDLIYKLKRIMERRRAELRIELSAKQKTKLRNDNHSDPTKCSQVAIDDTDETSYWKNVAKMFEIFEKGTVPYSDTVDALLKLTFSIRRALIMKWVPKSGRMEKFMDKHFPFLKLKTFIKFELIMKKSCEISRQKWTESAKLIVEAAKTTKKKQVAILLSSQRFQNMSPETYSRAALELLPFLVPGKGRGDKAARHSIDGSTHMPSMST